MDYIKLEIANHKYSTRPRIVEGSHAQVEELLRAWFPDETLGIPTGDLLTVMKEIGRSHGIEMAILGGVLPVEQPHLHPRMVKEPPKEDMWK